jgi:Uma2 family endonuclease
MASPGKHEFFDGQIYAMAGGTEDHSALSVAVTAALLAATRGGPGRVHSSDLRIYVEAIGLATYPDGSVICGPLEQHRASPKATALNPTVLIEVTSDSSEDYDTGFKLEAYQTVPSLRDYVVVSHRERRIRLPPQRRQVVDARRGVRRSSRRGEHRCRAGGGRDLRREHDRGTARDPATVRFSHSRHPRAAQARPLTPASGKRGVRG